MGGFAVEYAKSNRSSVRPETRPLRFVKSSASMKSWPVGISDIANCLSSSKKCRKCKDTISQDTVRVAKMVPSRHFDGDEPHWHHVKCIIKPGLVTEVSLLKGFDSLRWDDQQRLKKALGFEADDATKKTSAPAEEEDAEPVALIANVKYSGGNKTCDGCTESFGRGIPRAVMTEGGATYHLDEECWKLPANITTDAISGYEKLKIPDREHLREMIEKVNPASASVNSKVVESAEAKAARESSEAIWKAKDSIKKEYNAWELKALLRYNEQAWLGLGPTDVIDRVAEAMVNGALPKCPECKNIALRPASAGIIKCSAHINAWTRCTFESKSAEIKRNKWKTPTLPTLEKQVDLAKDDQANKNNAFHDGPSAADIFQGLVFIVLGSWPTHADDVKKIEAGGGTISSTFTQKVTHVLASYDEVTTTPARAVAKRTKALASTLQVLDPRIIAYCSTNKKTLKILDNIESFIVWKDGAAVKPDDTEVAVVEKKKKRKRLVVPPLDKDFEDRENYQIYVANNCVYAMTLNHTDLSSGDRGKNSVYVMQALQHKTKKTRFVFFTKWGRIGTDLNWKEDDYNSPGPMIQLFEEKFFKMTKNHFESYMNNEFEQKPFGYSPVDLDAEDEDGEEEEELTAEAVKERKKRVQALVEAAEKKPKAEKLCPRVAELISLMFDKSAITKQMQEMNIDTKKMPLGQMSKKTLREGVELLEKIEALIKEPNYNKTKLLGLCSQFYTKVPHDFGMAAPTPIDNAELLQKKYDLLDTLMDIEVAARMLEAETPDEEDPLMLKYKELGNTITAVDKSSDEWKRLVAYATNTQGHTKLKILDIYKVARKGEAESFDKHKTLDYRKLLFHGSSVAVFPAILSGGIKIMPHSGGRVGRGNYSADMIDKSQGYVGKAGKIGLILLNEVALGTINRIYQDNSRLVVAPNGHHSVLACGRLQPDESLDYVDTTLSPSGHPVIIPQGKGINMKDASDRGTSFMHNEYLVYDASQVHMRYLLRLEWPY